MGVTHTHTKKILHAKWKEGKDKKVERRHQKAALGTSEAVLWLQTVQAVLLAGLRNN